MHCITNTKKTK